MIRLYANIVESVWSEVFFSIIAILRLVADNCYDAKIYK